MAWLFYVAGDGERRWRFRQRSAPCFVCRKPLELVNYRAECCGRSYRTGWNEVRTPWLEGDPTEPLFPGTKRVR